MCFVNEERDINEVEQETIPEMIFFFLADMDFFRYVRIFSSLVLKCLCFVTFSSRPRSSRSPLTGGLQLMDM